MIWGIVALVIALAGAVYWIFRQGSKVKGLAKDLRHEKALSEQKQNVMDTFVRSIDRSAETDRVLEDVKNAKTVGELVGVYRDKFSSE